MTCNNLCFTARFQFVLVEASSCGTQPTVEPASTHQMNNFNAMKANSAEPFSSVRMVATWLGLTEASE